MAESNKKFLRLSDKIHRICRNFLLSSSVTELANQKNSHLLHELTKIARNISARTTENLAFRLFTNKAEFLLQRMQKQFDNEFTNETLAIILAPLDDSGKFNSGLKRESKNIVYDGTNFGLWDSERNEFRYLMLANGSESGFRLLLKYGKQIVLKTASDLDGNRVVWGPFGKPAVWDSNVTVRGKNGSYRYLITDEQGRFTTTFLPDDRPILLGPGGNPSVWDSDAGAGGGYRVLKKQNDNKFTLAPDVDGKAVVWGPKGNPVIWDDEIVEYRYLAGNIDSGFRVVPDVAGHPVIWGPGKRPAILDKNLKDKTGKGQFRILNMHLDKLKVSEIDSLPAVRGPGGFSTGWNPDKKQFIQKTLVPVAKSASDSRNSMAENTLLNYFMLAEILADFLTGIKNNPHELDNHPARSINEITSEFSVLAHQRAQLLYN